MTPVVFLHGFLGSPAEWLPVMESLEGPRRIFAPELPQATDWQSGMERLLATLPERFILIGYSMGARIGLGLAIEHARRVAGLLLVAGHPGLEPLERAARRAQDEAVAARLAELPADVFLDQWYRQSVFATVDEATRRRWTHERRAMDRPAQANLLRCYSLGAQPDYWGRLAGICVPMNFVVGQQDEKYVAIGQAMQQRAPRLRLSIVPEAGHAVHRQQPAAMRNLLQAFLASVPEEEECQQ
jgi:2-succinyl-6-hydroxy-2,4-cyclohexadiene-1-carboxylate synthase